MPLIRISRFLRNLASLIVIAGVITGYTMGIHIGIALYCVTLAVSLICVENVFLAADDQMRGQNEQKGSGDVGKSDVTKIGP